MAGSLRTRQEKPCDNRPKGNLLECNFTPMRPQNGLASELSHKLHFQAKPKSLGKVAIKERQNLRNQPFVCRVSIHAGAVGA